MPRLPFFLRRPWLLLRGAFAGRDQPRLGRLESIADPDAFVWAILPHAARSFAPSILLLPGEAARAAAVGYLYARMLDTYEDLSASPDAARDALRAFAGRLSGGGPTEAPLAPLPTGADLRDRTHLLLIERHRLVDDVYSSLDAKHRDRISRLVSDMAGGMSEFSAIFERQGGVLVDEQQVLDYCRRVIGLPALFVMEMLLHAPDAADTESALQVSELIQLANITRDVEKDLSRGVGYHPALTQHLGTDGRGREAAAVATARADLMLLAVRRAPAFRRLVGGAGLPWFSGARAAAVLMMLFTDRHYRSCARLVGLSSWSGPSNLVTMLLAALPAALSPRWAERVLLRVERDLLAVAGAEASPSEPAG